MQWNSFAKLTGVGVRNVRKAKIRLSQAFVDVELKFLGSLNATDRIPLRLFVALTNLKHE